MNESNRELLTKILAGGWNEKDRRWINEEIVRLILAACGSYDVHCGIRAVECAEEDLLGRALEALKWSVDNAGECLGDHHAVLRSARAVLAEGGML